MTDLQSGHKAEQEHHCVEPSSAPTAYPGGFWEGGEGRGGEGRGGEGRGEEEINMCTN